MLVLEAENIRKYYSDRLIISLDELRIYSGEKIGVVGQNGSGKTTLLDILSGGIEPDEGFVRKYCDIAYIRQFSEEKLEAGPKARKEFNLTQVEGQGALSGGERTRVKLANALGGGNLLLFADEPTSNLDYKGIEILKQKLLEVDTFLLVSHDRMLLDSLCNRIIEVRDGKIRSYSGNYTFYKEQTQTEFETAGQEYEKYASERARLEEAISDRRGRSKSMRKAPKRMGLSEARLHRRSANEKQEKLNNAVNSLKTRLEHLEAKEKPRELPAIRLDFSLTNPPESKVVISAEKLCFSYGSRRIFDDAAFRLFNRSKTALWGENGSGKSTLLNLISGRWEGSIEGCIRIAPKAKIGYFYQGFENLDYNKSVLDNVMSGSVQDHTSARTILARLLIAGDDVFKRVGVLSGGERIKVSFAKLIVSSANLLLLDEPTNFLDMMSIEALENVLREYEGTVLFVSHDRAFVNAVADRLLIIENKRIADFEGDLDGYRAACESTKKAAGNETERLMLEIKLTEVVSKLSKPCADKESLESEYQRLVSLLR